MNRRLSKKNGGPYVWGNSHYTDGRGFTFNPIASPRPPSPSLVREPGVITFLANPARVFSDEEEKKRFANYELERLELRRAALERAGPPHCGDQANEPAKKIPLNRWC